MTATHHTITAGPTPAEKLAQDMNDLLSAAARSGAITPPQLADLLTDALAQTMCFGVEPGRMEESLNLQAQMLRAAVYRHVQRMAHLRAQPPATQPTGKAN